MSTLRSNGSLGFRWSVNGVACSAFGNYALQRSSVEDTGEEYMVKDAAGNTLIWYGYDHKKVADFEYIVTGNSSTISASVTMPKQSDLLTVTDTLSSPIASTNYVVQSAKLDLTNTEGAKVSVKATAWDNITA